MPSLTVLVTGSRSIHSRVVVEKAIESSGYEIAKILTGGAKGVDQIALTWAAHHGVTARTFCPDWKLYGKAAGPIRNREMVSLADAVVAVWDRGSRGTAHTIACAKAAGKPVRITIGKKTPRPNLLPSGYARLTLTVTSTAVCGLTNELHVLRHRARVREGTNLHAGEVVSLKASVTPCQRCGSGVADSDVIHILTETLYSGSDGRETTIPDAPIGSVWYEPWLLGNRGLEMRATGPPHLMTKRESGIVDLDAPDSE